MTTFGTLTREGVLVDKMEIDLNSLPSSDPLAFGYGIAKGKRYKQEDFQTFEEIHGSKYSELSQEYLRGFLLGNKGILIKEGVKIKKGYERNYYHSKDNTL